MKVTKQLIDEFESEFVDLMCLFEGLKYNFSTESYLDALGFCPDDAVTLNICLDVWLKQREKVEGIASVLEATLDDDLNARNPTESYNALIKGIMEALKLCQPQESGDE